VASRALSARIAVPHREGMRPVVICWPPAVRAVTGGAVRAEQPDVIAGLRMAAHTRSGRPGVLPILVAGGARSVAVIAGQWKTRLAVIEGSTAPTAGGVAGGAVGAEGAVVGVVLTVAAHTSRGRPGVLPVLVTRGTRYAGVLAVEWETRLAVIEGCAAPTACRVAGSAVRAEGTIVGVVLTVAAHTSRGCPGVLSILVAGGAGHAGVLAVQRESGLIMIEGGAVPTAR
jgi:hypothetical protein